MAKGKMQKIGKGIKDTFIEMSESLAGWIDDTGAQFYHKKRKTQPKTKMATPAKNKSAKNSRTTNSK